MQLNKYQAILIAKLVSEHLKDQEVPTIDYGLMLELEQDLSAFIMSEREVSEIGAGG